MNDWKLRSLALTNFKAFTYKVINIDSDDLSLLDGPNGFGKTTFFDALELLFTGAISRYSKWDADVSNTRAKFGEHPLLNNKAKKTESLIVEAIFKSKNDELVIRRVATVKSLDVRRVSDAYFELQHNVNSEWLQVNDNEQRFFELNFGSNYRKNYGVMHYIPQEDNTYFLKSKETKKQNDISHLFKVDEYQQKLNKISEALTLINKLKAPAVERAITEKTKQIQQTRQNISKAGESVDYFRLIESVDLPWDLQILPLDNNTLLNWLHDAGEPSRLSKLVENKFDYINHVFNQKINRDLGLINKDREQSDLGIEFILRFGNSLESLNYFSDQLSNLKASELSYENLSQDILQAIEQGVALPSEQIYSACLQGQSREALQTEIQALKVLVKSSGDLEKTLNNFKHIHSQYIKEHELYLSLSNDESNKCPTCGFDWQSRENLLKSFEQQTSQIKNLLNESSTELTVKVKQVNLDYIQPIKADLARYISSFSSKREYFEAICKLNDKEKSYITRLKSTYKKYEIDLSKYYANSFNLDVKQGIKNVRELAVNMLKEVNYDLIENDFDYIFEQVLNNNIDELVKLDVNQVKNKITYINQRYIENQLVGIKEQEKIVACKQEDLKRAKAYHDKLTSLKKIYQSLIKEYISNVSKGIEILFHIYTGRLLQNYNRGLGVFIDHQGDKLSFKETPDSAHDALFSMSSGQLSALLIAFTLALNHKYAQNNMLMIDDPVQTMDEINMSAFIDLLRYEFKERQIFISTHEDHISTYFRYKFKKANLSPKRINFMKLSREVNN